MDFLMTYGWAILVVLIAIGMLAYFGILNPDKLVPVSTYCAEYCREIENFHGCETCKGVDEDTVFISCYKNIKDCYTDNANLSRCLDFTLYKNVTLTRVYLLSIK